MNVSTVTSLIISSGHFIGLAGVIVCLLQFYMQLCGLFVFGIGGWSGFRLERIFGLVQRFLWLILLTGLSLIVLQGSNASGFSRSSFLGDKLLLIFLLCISTLGLRGLVRNLFLSIEGGGQLIRKIAQSLWLKLCLSVSVGAWCAMIFLAYCYLSHTYSHGWMVIIFICGLSIVFAALLALNDKWINLRASHEVPGINQQ